MSSLSSTWRGLLGGALPAVVGAVMLAGPGIGPRVFVDTRDPLPLEANAIVTRPCDLIQRDHLVQASGLEVTAYAEGRDGEFYTCTYQAGPAVVTLGLLEGTSVRLNSGDDVTLQDVLDEALQDDPGGSGVSGVGEGAVEASDGAVLARQGDLLVRLESNGLDQEAVRTITRLAVTAAVDRTG